MSTKDGGPAFPSPTANPIQNGQLTVRDYFAAQTFALMASTRWVDGLDEAAQKSGRSFASAFAEMAYKYADAMLTERAK